MDRYEALKHAIKAHGNALDKCGQLYVLHPIAVAEAVERNWHLVAGADLYGALPDRTSIETAIIIALLHDVWEDTDYDIPTGTLTNAQYTIFQAVTRLPDESYRQYIEGICNCEHSIAIIVKLADLWHNLQPERQDCLPIFEAISLRDRYLTSRDMLWEALGQKWWPA